MTTFVGTLEDGRTVWWDPDNCVIIACCEGNYQVVTRKYPSRPAISPDTRRFVYIAPSRWESIGNLYLWSLSTSKSDMLVGHDGFPRGSTPKQVVWLDNETVLMIVGYAFGSISQGGSIFHVDVETSEVGLIAVPGPKREYTDLEVTDVGVNAQLVEFDDSWLVSNRRKITFDKNQIKERVRRRVRPENDDF